MPAWFGEFSWWSEFIVWLVGNLAWMVWSNEMSAGAICKRCDATALGRTQGLQLRASERPAISCSELGAAEYHAGL